MEYYKSTIEPCAVHTPSTQYRAATCSRVSKAQKQVESAVQEGSGLTKEAVRRVLEGARRSDLEIGLCHHPGSGCPCVLGQITSALWVSAGFPRPSDVGVREREGLPNYSDNTWSPLQSDGSHGSSPQRDILGYTDAKFCSEHPRSSATLVPQEAPGCQAQCGEVGASL